ncbi:MAG: hypothetical protein HN417_00425 [Desulfobacula sp.]|jgi:hypothetical protein|nr:hypothetical protein [Desulfobacula sp.]MBT6341771.1 hypothetical protein [Desulfobacula sp.]MBT7259922.1 hypothetical protein [Desulfobacula sp.]
MTAVNDIVLIYLEDAPVFFARVESILPDAKKNWYHIKLLMLNIPLKVVTWILKDDYINGSEFHMNGQKMKLEKVECPPEDLPLKRIQTPSDKKIVKDKGTKKKTPSKIISFSDLKKKNEPESG